MASEVGQSVILEEELECQTHNESESIVVIERFDGLVGGCAYDMKMMMLLTGSQYQLFPPLFRGHQQPLCCKRGVHSCEILPQKQKRDKDNRGKVLVRAAQSITPSPYLLQQKNYSLETFFWGGSDVLNVRKNIERRNASI